MKELVREGQASSGRLTNTHKALWENSVKLVSGSEGYLIQRNETRTDQQNQRETLLIPNLRYRLYLYASAVWEHVNITGSVWCSIIYVNSLMLIT